MLAKWNEKLIAVGSLLNLTPLGFSHIKKSRLCSLAKFTCKSTFTWYPKLTQTGLKSQTALKCRSIYMAIYMEISLRQLSKQ